MDKIQPPSYLLLSAVLWLGFSSLWMQVCGTNRSLYNTLTCAVVMATMEVYKDAVSGVVYAYIDISHCHPACLESNSQHQRRMDTTVWYMIQSVFSCTPSQVNVAEAGVKNDSGK